MRGRGPAVLTPITIGTAGHVDHGKTALVAALTGTDTDRLPQEKARGLSIELGFAALTLPSGRPVSLVDVPGHERFIRTMVSGATGIDGYLMVVAAPDGVREQTVEHAGVLDALGIGGGIVAITKTDLAGGAAAAAQARELLPAATIVVCPPDPAARGPVVIAALEELAGRLPGRAGTQAGPAILHVDRCFTVAGAGTVITGTLISGEVAPDDRLTLYPAGREVRVRGVEVHGVAVARAGAGRRVAVNLARVARTEVQRGDALATPGALRAAYVIEVTPRQPGGEPAGVSGPAAVHVHHGTRATPARLGPGRRAGTLRLRCRRPLLIAPGDAVVLRDGAGRRTLGGATVLGPQRRASSGYPAPAPAPRPAAPPEAGPATRPALAVALAGDVPRAELIRVEAEIRAAIASDGSLTLPALRDRLGVSRREAKAFLDYFDAVGLTRRRADDTRVLRTRTPAR